MESEVEMSVLKSYCLACSQQAQHGQDGMAVRAWGSHVTPLLQLGSRGGWALLLSPGNGAASVLQASCSCLEMHFLSGSWLCQFDSINSHFQVVLSQDFSVLSQFIPYSYMYPESQHGVFSQVCQCLTDVVGVAVGMKRAYNTESSLGSSNLTLEVALGPLHTAIVHGNTSGSLILRMGTWVL